ncbi:MAG TPA: protein kinase, partial [Acidobacteriota bacterium]
MFLKNGSRLGAYEIIEPLGKGGMGEVYAARDLTLLRMVAIKVLAESIAKDPDHSTRFEREARLLASLNHPNIAAIYGLEKSNGILFLVLELVPGKSLSDYIKNKALPISEALPIFRQIAEGLEAAHENGIIHRDLKPANVKITPDGKVKILDFGLAKAFKEAPTIDVEGSNVVTVASDATESGLVLGTAPYMSPEQLRGKVVDRRTDIWAFGCVLYEVLTGKRLFGGDNVSDTIAAILNTEPDWHKLPANTPPFFQRLIRKCLQKDPHHRIQNIGDARVELEDAMAHPQELTTQQIIVSSQSRIGKSMIWSMAALVMLLAFFIIWRWKGILQASQIHTIEQVLRLTDSEGLEEFPAISPDGKAVAFAADVTGTRQIWVRLLAGGPPLQITHDLSDHLYPRWSSDSASLLYYTPSETKSNGVIWEVSALGGSPRRILDSIGGVDLSHDGKQIAFFQFRG